MPADPGSPPAVAAPSPAGPVDSHLDSRLDSHLDRLLELPVEALISEAGRIRTEAHGNRVTFSPKVFIPLTMLCRDRCGYCTFAKAPARVGRPYLELDEVLAIARAGRAAGCHEALFTLGEASRGPLPAGPAMARRPRLRLHGRLPGGSLPGGGRGDRPPPPRQRRRARPRRAGAAAGGDGQPGDDGRIGELRARRPPLGSRQGPRPAPGHARGGRDGRRSPSPPACWSASASRAPTGWPRSRPSPPATAATATSRR